MITSFDVSDLSDLNTMIHSTIDYSYPTVYPGRAVIFFKEYHSEKKILDRYQKGKVLVIKNNDSIVATGSIVENEISGVFVAPANQGSGLGQSIMSELEHLAKEMGVSEIEIHSSLPAKQFYQKLNYTLLAKAHLDVGDGQHLEYWPGTKIIVP